MKRILCALAFTFVATVAGAQGNDAVARAISSWIIVDAPPGSEGRAPLNKLFAGWKVDSWGNYSKTAGSGAPHRVVACALDQSGYVVSQITDDGYLRLRRSGPNAPHPLWDQFHEAQRVRVLTKNGYVKATTAAANGHYAAFHRSDSLPEVVDSLWVDLGSSSRAETERLGVALLDPVVYDRPAWWFEGYATGPNAGARAGCAAVATAAAAGSPRTGTTTYVLSTQRIFGWMGLGAFLSRLGAVDAVTVFDDGRVAAFDGNALAPAAGGGRGGRGGRGGGAQAIRSIARGGIGRRGPLDSIRLVAPKVRWPGSIVESIHADDARALLAAAAVAADVSGSGDAWAALPLDTARVLTARTDAYGAYEKQFLALADLAGAPGHEWRVRNALLAALPKWARDKAVTDSAGNIVVVAGPDRDPQAIIAHMDEVGYEITQIMSDGRVALRAMGGAVATAWEGRPAYLHFNAGADGKAPESLRGVFVPRDSARLRAPGAMTAWFGLDSAALVAKGARVGLPVLAYKRGDRLSGTRLVARSNDDRAGSTALLFAVQRLDPAQLKRKTWFVWSVREEGGLNGAQAFGAEHGRELTRVYSIDTFVSSDTPLEDPRFAHAPLGKGAVLRGLDNGALTPPGERERILRIASGAQIPIQVGTTFGSTDGSAITALGPVNTSLSWPGRYSHGPAEVLDLRDVDSLARLVLALAIAP
jgi:putative aminopeptidase FrvX